MDLHETLTDKIMEFINEQTGGQALKLPSHFDKAIIGVDSDWNIVYDRNACIQIKMDVEHEGDYESALEDFTYNTEGSFGEGYPSYITTIADLKEMV